MEQGLQDSGRALHGAEDLGKQGKKKGVGQVFCLFGGPTAHAPRAARRPFADELDEEIIREGEGGRRHVAW